MNAKKSISAIGGIASFIGFSWVVHSAWLQRQSILELNFTLWDFSIYVVIYTITLLILALNWADIVLMNDRPNRVSKILLSTTFLRSQVLKYIPGNVFHYIGRHMAGKVSGASSAALIKSLVIESVILIAAALIVSCIALLASDFQFWAPDNEDLVWLALGAFMLSVGLMSVWYFAAVMRAAFLQLLIVLSRGILFMAALGLLMYLVVGWASDVSLIIGATSLAWVVGFVTPGSPGGIGTREAILVLLLEPSIGEATILAASLTLRAITISGDLFASAIGAAMAYVYNSTKAK